MKLSLILTEHHTLRAKSCNWNGVNRLLLFLTVLIFGQYSCQVKSIIMTKAI